MSDGSEKRPLTKNLWSVSIKTRTFASLYSSFNCLYMRKRNGLNIVLYSSFNCLYMRKRNSLNIVLYSPFNWLYMRKRKPKIVNHKTMCEIIYIQALYMIPAKGRKSAVRQL